MPESVSNEAPPPRARHASRRRLADLPIPKKLVLIIGVFIFIISILIGMSYLGFSLLSDVRAYVGGEGLWSKAQKDAVYHLMRYAIFHEEADYEAYRRHLLVPLGDRRARLALEVPRLDWGEVRAGLIQGRNHADDVRGMGLLFRRFLFIPYIRDAIAAWREGEVYFDQLIAVGDEIHAAAQSGSVGGKKTKEFLQRIDSINRHLTPIEDRFSYTLGEGARWIKRSIILAMLGIAGLLVFLGLWLAAHIARRMVEDITHLRKAAGRIAHGDFNTSIPTASRDEIGELAEHFRLMAAQRAAAERNLVERARELDDANRRLKETERMKDNFFATVSHELRTPLTLVLSPLEAMLNGNYGILEPSQLSTLQMMHNNAVRLLQMITGLLDFSKLEAGQAHAKREAVDLVELTQAILRDFDPLMRQKKLSSRFRCESAALHVWMDRYLYERILFNLISNAVKFTPEGGRIEIDLAWNDDTLQLRVLDNGIGIREEDIPKLFQKFHQLEGASTRRFEGTGLGLALVKEFAQLLEGEVRVKSRLDEGSAFLVRCRAPRAEASESLQAPRLHAAPVQRFGERELSAPLKAETGQEIAGRVLIAEDNVELASYMRSLLQSHCRVFTARDGEEAMEMVPRLMPELVLSDVMMPKCDGIKLCLGLKSNPATAHIPVVLVTALTHREALLKGWEAGADEYLFKPFHPQEFVTRVLTLLRAARERRHLEHMIIEAAETEKQRIAQDLHDGLCQELAGVSFLCRALSRRLASQGVPDASEAERLADMAQASSIAVRDLVQGLIPIELRQADLANALAELAASTERAYSIRCSFRSEEDLPAISKRAATHLYRIGQEAVANAVRHGKSKAIEIALKGGADSGIDLSISDDGKGFTEESLSRRGLGLLGMRYRAQAIGARLSVVSQPGQGCRISCHMPGPRQRALDPGTARKGITPEPEIPPR